jgi:hypothetical protein
MIEEKDIYKAQSCVRLHSSQIITAGNYGQKAVPSDKFTESLHLPLAGHSSSSWLPAPPAGGISNTAAFIAEQRSGRAELVGTRLVSVRPGTWTRDAWERCP